MKLTSATAVIAHMTMNVATIENSAVTSGTKARNDAKTKVSTRSAPSPPTSASTSTPTPVSLPLSLESWGAPRSP